MAERLRIGMIGLGMAAAPHAKSLIDLRDEVEVAAVFSPSPERRAAFGGKYFFPVAGSIDTILDDGSIAAVLVLTPPSSHLDLVRRAAAAGKHVLLEKPLEITHERSRELVDVAEHAGIRLGVVLQLRFRKSIAEVRRLLDEGQLGEIVSVSARLNNWRPQSYYDQPGRGTKARDGGGVLLTQAIHTLDQMIALTGLPSEVAAYAATSKAHRMETEDVAHAVMRFANGAIGAISATTAAYPGFPDGIDILGTKGSARLGPSGALLSFLDGTERTVSDGTRGSGAGADPMAFSNDNHRAVLADFLAALRDRRDPKVSGREALEAHRLIDAILRSSETGSRVTL
ncbi:Gfo/Idh/MocA family oxidoreductase [Aminobacter sp. AP02]|uniref:Gfo/Idh/MocA family protein n=1 Tax=Aminobacter sp. AP02 TaxID=2135737 RepID=UPI000D6B8A8E|nr:Gfo/Idh/MocA family oxidoreductase [Aminobacter sp. AP02]PWK74085.1 putative dehydrogenase [Aminobacter sp. AP02]